VIPLLHTGRRLLESLSPLLRIESAAVALSREYAAALATTDPSRYAAVLEIDGAAAIFAGSDSPLSKTVGVGGAFGERSVDAVERFYRERGAAPAIELSPLAPSDLSEQLTGRGYDEEYSLLVMRHAVVEAPEPSGDQSVEIVGDADPKLWAATVASGFSGLSHELLLEIFTANAIIPSVTRWLAMIDDEPIGGATMSIHNGVAHLFGTSVLPEFRRRGVQRALLAARLDFARRNGCDIATVVASPGSDSERNLKRAGFVEGWMRRVYRSV
jgi:GNAT superfamily N-acetyltransferase